MNIGFRTLHLLFIGLLLGGHFFGVDPERLKPFLYGSIASGAGLIAVEVYPTCHWLFMGSGLSVILKLVILCLVPFFWEQRVYLLIAVLVIASIASHMPGWFKHYSLLERRVIRD